jgi:hypothetical protein
MAAEGRATARTLQVCKILAGEGDGRRRVSSETVGRIKDADSFSRSRRGWSDRRTYLVASCVFGIAVWKAGVQAGGQKRKGGHRNRTMARGPWVRMGG